jgi:hypothetical protein
VQQFRIDLWQNPLVMKNNSINIFEKGFDVIKNLWSPTAEKSGNTNDDEHMELKNEEEFKITSSINSLQGLISLKFLKNVFYKVS